MDLINSNQINIFIFLIHMSSCLLMTGIIWIIQIVHYPSFNFICQKQFKNFEIFHTKSISYIVGPIMITELMSGLYFVIFLNNINTLNIINLILLVGIWISTALISVPLHNKLTSNGYNSNNIHSLILTNWIRTILWTIRTAISMIIIIQQINKA